MRKILITIMLLMLLMPFAVALPDVYDQLRGRQMVGDGGAPWFKDNAVMYFGTDKDGSIKYNSTSGYTEVVGFAAVENTSLTMVSGEDFTFAGGDSLMNLASATGLFSSPTGVFLINGNGKVTGTKTFMVNGGAAIFGSSVTAASLVNNGTLTQTGVATFTAAPVFNGGGTVATGQTWAITSADKLTVGGKIVPQTVPVSVYIGASPVDGTIWTAPYACKILSIKEAHSTAQNTAYPNTGSVTLYKAANGENSGAGTALHNSTMYLNSTADTVVTPTMNAATDATTFAANQRVVANFNGTVTTLAGMGISLDIQRL